MEKVKKYLKSLKITSTDGDIEITSVVDGTVLGKVQYHNSAQVIDLINRSPAAFEEWRKVPAPKRGELIRLLGEELRRHKEDLGRLVTAECGKIYQEGLGEVQEMIDICDFAVGLSRQLYGLTMGSERPGHKLMETWHPLGPVGIISAFNFPVAVWAWNFALAVVCGDSVIWKPSEKTILSALACQKIFEKAAKRFTKETGTNVPANLSQVIIGDVTAGEILTRDPIIKLVSATGSTKMGRAVAPVVAKRFGKCLLELGGNNGMIVTPSADLDLTLKAIVFSAVGTAGQRCTTLRRVFIHESIYNNLIPKLKKVYDTIAIGNPLDEKNLIGPIIDLNSFVAMGYAIRDAIDQGGTVHGGERLPNLWGYYMKPAIIEMPTQTNIVRTETFAPLLYIMKYTDLDEAIRLHNDVPQGLSSCIFSNDIRETEKFLVESDCGIANVNIGPSGAEIGGSFGGEKETGGGRESGTDSWRSYMRRSTNTINYSTELPLAQGIKFDI